jgi:hypothetical protein
VFHLLDAISQLVREALRSAGLGWARPKHLRSTVATHLFRNGVALSTVQEILSHRTVETTQRYASADVDMLREELNSSEFFARNTLGRVEVVGRRDTKSTTAAAAGSGVAAGKRAGLAGAAQPS